MLHANGSFMDRVDTTGVLTRKTAEDFGVIGLAGRASGIALDLRSHTFPYTEVNFHPAMRQEGDVLSRLNARFDECEESVRMIKEWLNRLPEGDLSVPVALRIPGCPPKPLTIMQYLLAFLNKQ